MKRSTHHLMTREDESEFSRRLLEAVSEARFIDGQRWHSLEPPTVFDIAECEDRFEAYIWHSGLHPNIYGKPTEFGYFQGLFGGPLIQFMRSRMLTEKERLDEIRGALENLAPEWRALAEQKLRGEDPCFPVTGPELRGGRIAVVVPDEDEEMKEFVKLVWKVFRKVTTDHLVAAVNGNKAWNTRIGHHAASWAREDPSHRLRDAFSARLYFRVPDE